jgi:hypothetical protein
MTTTATRKAARPYLGECIDELIDLYADDLTPTRRTALSVLCEAYVAIDVDYVDDRILRAYGVLLRDRLHA